MSPESWLLVLRLVLAGLLYAFLASLLVIMIRDLRAVAAAEPSHRRRYGRLVVVSADGTGVAPGSEFPLLPITSIGRSPTNTITVPDSFASAEHSLLSYRAGQWWLEDLHSRNGTTLNGTRLDEAAVVSSGDIIGVGRMQLKIELE